MSYKVLSIAPFDRQLKKLIKKYPSLKKEFSALIDSLEQDPNKVLPLVTVVSRFVCLLLPKAKENPAGPE